MTLLAKLTGRPVALLVALLALRFVPAWWCGRDAGRWIAGDTDLADGLARSVDRWVRRPLQNRAFATGSRRFDGEWRFGSYMMAAMGAGQLALAHGRHAKRHLADMRRAIALLRSPAARRFDREAWRGEDALASLGGRSGHAAYLGYLNLALSLQRLVAGEATPSADAQLNDRISAALLRRLRAARFADGTPGLLETYPGEVYPVDNTAVVASLALHARATDASPRRRAEIRSLLRRLLALGLDKRTGLLNQSLRADSGAPLDEPRGSGSALAVYFVSFADRAAARRIFGAVKRRLEGALLGFGMVREYPPGTTGRGDIDSGPIVLGYGVSATGFAIGAARACGDDAALRRLYATLHLFGAPRRSGAPARFELVAGGPLGNAIMLAMLTAPRVLP